MSAAPAASDTVRLYYYTTRAWGMKTLWERRLKISRYPEANDLFELLPFALDTRRSRSFWADCLARLGTGAHGVVCFSDAWNDPRMWSHYGQKQTGLCLGFDVLRAFARPVAYLEAPLPDPFAHRQARRRLPDAVLEAALQHKPAAWRHEREWRVRAPLGAAQDGLHYLPLDRGIELREVILGPRCSLAPGDVLHAVESPPVDVDIFATRAAWGSFEIVRHEEISTHQVPGFRQRLSQAPDATWELGADWDAAPAG